MPVAQRGTTMMELLVTILILAFGMLGLAGMQAKVHLAEMESYQRAQAIVLLSDMMERINANRGAAPSYVTATAVPLGTGNTSQPTSCTTLAMGVARDQCEWHYALLGSAERSGTTNIGAMIGARGCIEQVQASSPAPACVPATYRVTVAWQGINDTVAPVLACGAGSYGSTTLRRAISANVSVALTSC
jgi:type IV pilus assembly protein PilV